MSFTRIYTNKNVLSLEFFPPKQKASLASALRLMESLGQYNPSYMTVTYHPGGGSRDGTREMVVYANRKLSIPSVAHLTCVGHSVAEIDSILDLLHNEGVSMILALRGDPPLEYPGFVPHPNGFSCARDLIAHIAKRGGFSLAAAGYPETHRDAESPEKEIEYLKQKVDAGAEVILTQLFFDLGFYYDFRDRCQKAGITVPIVPGIMPIGNVVQLKRFTSMCGAFVPLNIVKKLESIQGDAKAVENYGIELAIEMCTDLLKEGVPGLHIYTLNKSSQIFKILKGLGRDQVR